MSIALTRNPKLLLLGVWLTGASSSIARCAGVNPSLRHAQVYTAMHQAAAEVEATTYAALLKAEPGLPRRVHYFLGLCHYERGDCALAQVELKKVADARAKSSYRDVARACLVAAQCSPAGGRQAGPAGRLGRLHSSARTAPRVLAEILRACIDLQVGSDLRAKVRRDLTAALSMASSRSEAQFCRIVLAWDAFLTTGQWQGLIDGDFTVPECEFRYKHTSRKSGQVRTFRYRFHNPALLRYLAAAYYAKAAKELAPKARAASAHVKDKIALADALLGLKRAADAVKALDRVRLPKLRGQPDGTIDAFAAMALKARCLAASGQRQSARNLLAELATRAEKEPDQRVQPLLLCHLARTYMESGIGVDPTKDHAKALTLLQRAAKALETSRNVAAFLERRGYSAAKPFRCPLYMPVYRALGRCHVHRGEHERALAEYERTYDVTSIGSESVMPSVFLVRMADSLVRARKFAWALEMYTDRRMLGQYRPGIQIRHAIEVLTFARDYD